jgi:hypothetical protein
MSHVLRLDAIPLNFKEAQMMKGPTPWLPYFPSNYVSSGYDMLDAELRTQILIPARRFPTAKHSM